jgi:acetyl esterase
VQKGLLRSTPERLLRAMFKDPPRNDRGIEMDLRTHVLLSLMALGGLGQIHRMPVAKARRHYDRDGGLLDLPTIALAQRHDFELPGPAGPLRCRLYRPHGIGDRPPVLLWFHGGGFVIGGLESHAGACAWLAARARCVIVAVDYRKSPEHKFPAASDDGLASIRWMREHGPGLDVDPERIAIGGDSAGANLSAGLCHRLRDAGELQPALQVLLYPMTQHRAPFPSRTHFGEGAMLTTDMIEWFRSQYLRGPDDANHPLVSPLLSPDFAALAPAIIRTAGFDPLRDEGEAYAKALAQAGVSVDYRCHERLIHGFLTMGGAIPAMRQAIDDLGDDLAVALGGREPARSAV